MNTNDHDVFKYRKSNWKRKSKKVMDTVTKMFEDIAYGRRPNLHDIWTHAHDLVALGQTAIELNEMATTLRKSKRTLQDISRAANLIESASQHLQAVSQTIGMPSDMPTFVSPLIFEASVETPTLTDVLSSEDKGE